MALLYALFAGLVVAAVLLILLTPHVHYASIGLLCTLLSMAAIYFLQGASLVAVACVIVYGSGVLIMLLFGALVLPLDTRKIIHQPPKWIIGSLIAGLWGVCQWPLIHFAVYTLQQQNIVYTPQTITVTELGLQLLGPYALAFEWMGLNLLIALVGTAYIMQKKPNL